MSTLAVIDADSIVYAAAFAAQDWAIFDEDGNMCNVYDSKSDAKEAAIHAGDVVEPQPRSDDDAKANADSIIDSIILDLNPDQLQVWLTHPDSSANFRKSVDPNYKENRKNFVKPYHFKTVRQHLLDSWEAEVSREGWEADDEVAAIGWQSHEQGNVVICSIDKDLDTVPGYHYRWRTYNRDAKDDMTPEEIKTRMHTNCTLLHLLRHDNDKWEPPEV